MNQREHKAEAERLAAVARRALGETASQITNHGVTDFDSFNVALTIIRANTSLAQVHATLATIPDPLESPWPY